MSYSFIINAKYKAHNLNMIYAHNERKVQNYMNKEINTELSKNNYSFKKPNKSYVKEFKEIKEKYNLQGRLTNNSIIACEYIIKSDKYFFDEIGSSETKRFFKTAYQFVCEYKELGEKYIISAIVHMDEIVPHMHLIYIPVLHIKDNDGNLISKVCSSEFWKERDSYRRLQDDFHTYIISHGFNLERGQLCKTRKLSIYDFKTITNFNKIHEIVSKTKTANLNTSSIEIALSKNKELTQYCHKLETYCISSFNVFNRLTNFEIEINNLKSENKELYAKIKNQANYIETIIKTITNHFNITETNLFNILLKEDRSK